MAILFQARTDVGRVREQNEDNFLVDRKLQLYVVCDGMGGHASGEVASATAVNVVRDMLLEHSDMLAAYQRGDDQVDRGDVRRLLIESVQRASARIYERARLNPQQRGMGTTLSMLLLLGRRAFIAHVGDSRIYRRHGDEIEQLTEDHSLYNAMLRSGAAPSEDDPRIAHLKNAVTRAVGVQEEVEVDTMDIDLHPSDRFLLCSDGLSGYFEDGDLERLIAEEELSKAVDVMIDFANTRGGRDNITALVIQLPDDADFHGAVGSTRLDEVLRRTGFAHGLNSRELRVLCRRMVERVLQPGEILVPTDTAPTGLWVAAEGELIATSDQGTSRRIRSGEVACETALLAGARHKVEVRAWPEGQVKVLGLTRRDLRRLTGEDPALLARVVLNLSRRVAGRLAAAGDALGDPIWRYGMPGSDADGPRPRGLNPRRSVTTVDLTPEDEATEDTMPGDGDAAEDTPPQQGASRGVCDTMPNIPQAEIRRRSEVGDEALAEDELDIQEFVRGEDWPIVDGEGA